MTEKSWLCKSTWHETETW